MSDIPPNPSHVVPDSVGEKVKKTPKKATKELDPKQLSRYRWMVFGRFCLALFGGYALAAMVSVVLPMFFSEDNKAHAVLAATMFTFIIYCAVFIWVFLVQSTYKAWFGVISAIVICFVGYLLMKGL